jgi:hypothetical protein
MDKTPSLTRALVGLTLLIAVIAGGYLALKWGSDNENENAAQRDEPSVLVKYEEIGGWTGEETRMTLLTDGTGSVSWEKPHIKGKHAEAEVTLADRELHSLTAALDATPLGKRRIRPNAVCYDCNEYTIEYRGASVKIWLPNKRFRPAIRILDEISEDALRL